MMAQKMRLLLRRDGVVAAGVLVGCLALYIPTLAPSVVIDDGAEFQMVSTVLGVAHPTGYPLYTILGWIFTRLPLGGDPAYRVTMFTAVSAALAIALLYLLVRELDVARIPGLVAAFLMAAATRYWRNATAAEVYALAAAFAVLGLWLLVRWSRGKTPLWAVALAFGFGLAHHISIWLLGPPVLVYLLANEIRLPLRPRRWLPALVCLVLPFLVYVYVPLRAAYFENQPQWAGRILDVRKVIAAGYVSPHYYGGGVLRGLILAGDYSSAFLRPRPGQGWLEAGQEYLQLTRQQFPILAAPIALLGVVILTKRRPKASLLLLLVYVVVLAAALRFLALVGEDGDNFNLVHLLFAVWFAVGAGAFADWLGARLGVWLGPRLQGGLWPRALVLVALAALPVWSIVTHSPHVQEQRRLDTGQDVLSQPLPAGAVVVGDWRWITPLRYRQRVEGVRPDLWILQGDPRAISMLMQRALTDDIPYYVLRKTSSRWRLLPLPVRDPRVMTHPVEGMRLGPSVRWLGYDLESEVSRPGDVLLITLYWQADGPTDKDWKTFIHLVDERGQVVGQVDRVPLAEFYPPSQWQPGVQLADQYELPLQDTLPPGRYRLLFGWYSGSERLTWADGQDARPLAEITIMP